MAKVKQNRPYTASVTLFDSTDGSPLTGIVAGDITLYFKKAGSSIPVEKDISSSNFREVDATAMPGIYEVDFTGAELNTVGELVVTIAENGGVNLEQKNFTLEVEKDDQSPDDLNYAQTSLLDQNSTPTLVVELRDGDGNRVEGITQDYVEPVFFKNGSEDTTNTTFDAWSEVDDVFYPGLYSLQLPSGATDTVGDLIMRVQKNWDYAATTLTNSFDSGTSADSFDDGTNKLALFGTDNGVLYENTTFTETSPGSWSQDSAYASATGGVEPLDIDIAWDSGNSDFIKAISTPNGSLWVYKAGTWTEYDTGINIRLTHPVIFGPNLITVNSNEDDEIFKWDGATISSYYTAASSDAWFVGAKVDADTTDELWLGNTNGLFRIQDVTIAASLEDISSRLAGHTTERINDIVQKPTSGDVGVVASDVFWYSTDSGTSFVQRDLPIVRNSFAGEVDPETGTSLSAITYDAYDPNEAFTVGAAFDLLINREVSGSEGTDWEQVTFEGQGFGTASNLGFVPHRFIAGSVDTVDEDNFEAGIWNYRDIPFFYPPFLRFSVRDDFGTISTDLASILADIADIQGSEFDTNTDALDNLYDELAAIQGTGFISNDDSLATLSGDIATNASSLSSISGNVTTLRNDVTSIKGPNFVESIHSLSADYEETPFVGDLEQNTSATVTVKVGERTGIDPADLEADLVKAGTVDTTSLLASWQEVDSTNLPGVYRFTLSNTDTDTLGDLLVRIEQATGTSSEFLGVQFLQPSLEDLSFSGDPVDVAAIDDQGVLVITDGGGFIPSVAVTTNGGSSWSNISIPISQNPGRRIAYNSTTNIAALLMGSGSLTLALAEVDGIDDFTNKTLSSTAGIHTFTQGVIEGSGLSIVDDGAGNDFIWIASGDNEGNSPPTGHVIRVDDTGGTDSVVQDGTGVGANGEIYFDVFAIDDQTAIIVGSEWQTADTSTPHPRIYKTTDGGSSWATVYTEAAIGIPAQVEFDSTGQYGFASNIVNAGTGELGMLRTTDGGDNWTKVTSTLGGSAITGRNGHRGLHVIDQDNVIVGITTTTDGPNLDDEFYLLQSKDGGQTFNKVDVSSTLTSGVLRGIDGAGNQTFGAVEAPSPSNNDVVQYGHNPNPDPLKDLSYKFRVVGETSVDLSPIITDLDEIKGSGFNTGTDSLEQIRNTQEDIKGGTFDTNTDSLEQIRDNLSSVNLTPVTDALDEIKGAGFDDTNSLVSLTSDVSSVETVLQRAVGLSQENYRITNQSYNDDNKLISATIKIYGSANDADNDVNPIATYSLSATYNAQGLLIDYKTVKQT